MPIKTFEEKVVGYRVQAIQYTGFNFSEIKKYFPEIEKGSPFSHIKKTSSNQICPGEWMMISHPHASGKEIQDLLTDNWFLRKHYREVSDSTSGRSIEDDGDIIDVSWDEFEDWRQKTWCVCASKDLGNNRSLRLKSNVRGELMVSILDHRNDEESNKLLLREISRESFGSAIIFFLETYKRDKV